MLVELDMEVSNNGQNEFDSIDENSASTAYANTNRIKTSALILLKLENEFKVASTALDCINEDVTTLMTNKVISLRNEFFARFSQKNIVIDSEISSVFETAVSRNPFEGLYSEYFRD